MLDWCHLAFPEQCYSSHHCAGYRFHPSAWGTVFTHLLEALFSPDCEVLFSPNCTRCCFEGQRSSFLERLARQLHTTEHWDLSADHDSASACKAEGIHPLSFLHHPDAAPSIHLLPSLHTSLHPPLHSSAKTEEHGFDGLHGSPPPVQPQQSLQQHARNQLSPSLPCAVGSTHTRKHTGRGHTKRWWWREGMAAVTGSKGLEAWGTGTSDKNQLVAVRALKLEVLEHQTKTSYWQ